MYRNCIPCYLLLFYNSHLCELSILKSMYTLTHTHTHTFLIIKFSTLQSTWSCAVTFILPVLDKYLEATIGNHLFDSITTQFFADLMAFIDCTLFNELIVTKAMCTCSNAFQIKLELSQFEQWLTQSLKLPELR